MATIAIIAEYNPFHNGHKYQIDEARRIFGKDTEIVAIMSGNYVQRGELAITDKGVRAKASVLEGVNLVIEIPFPYSTASAEFYAKSGVSIADSLGTVDYLFFGSESGNIDELNRIAENMLTDKYKESLAKLQKENAQTGYALLCEMAYNEAYGETEKNLLSLPNNILAIEYIKAIKALNSSIKPFTIKRLGAGYNEQKVISGQLQSASTIRNLLRQDFNSADDYIPFSTKLSLFEAKKSGSFPADCDKISSAVISNFLTNHRGIHPEIHDTAGGLYNRLLNNSKKSTSISELVNLTETKHYTNARIRRSIWFSLFGVTSSEVKVNPLYTQILAMDSVGKQILKRIKKSASIGIITKPSATSMLSQEATKQKEKADIADALYGLSLPKPRTAQTPLKFTPFVK